MNLNFYFFILFGYIAKYFVITRVTLTLFFNVNNTLITCKSSNPQEYLVVRNKFRNVQVIS